MGFIMRKNQQGNDEVIAQFFKKSLAVIFAFVVLATLVYVFKNSNKEPVKIKEQSYQQPKQLQKNIHPPKTLFVEEAAKRGIDFTPVNGATGQRLLPETMGQGVAFIDFDNDGDEDLFLVNSSNWPEDDEVSPKPIQHLYENDGSGHFTDVSAKRGVADTFYGTGVAIGDVNNDGFLDIFVSAVGKNHLYINHNGEKFSKSEVRLDCAKDAWSTSAGFFDYDNDGDLDLMVLNYVQWSKELDLAADYKIDGIGRAYGPPNNFPSTFNCLFENVAGQFQDVTKSAGIKVKNTATGQFSGKSLALTFLDINDDGWQDVVVANDTTRNFVFINQQDKTFKEQGAEVGLAYNASGKATGAMGLDTAFYKNDADLAVTIGNFANEMTSFYVNRANLGFFTDESVITGIGPQSRLALSFGLFFFDYDLDGRLDFFQTNGHVENAINKVQSAQHYAQKSQLFWNCGTKCERTFVALKETGDLSSIDMVGRAASYADIDGDGDLDIVVTQVARPVKLFINKSSHGNWIGIKLKSKQSVMGAKITVTTDKATHKVSYSPTKSYLSQVQLGQIIGIGNGKITKVVVSSHTEVKEFHDLGMNRWHTIEF